MGRRTKSRFRLVVEGCSGWIIVIAVALAVAAVLFLAFQAEDQQEQRCLELGYDGKLTIGNDRTDYCYRDIGDGGMIVVPLEELE